MSRYYDKLFKRMELPRSQKNSVGMACCPESVEFLSPSQARGFSGGFSGHQGVVRNVADQLVLKTVEMPTLAVAASELGRRGNQGAVRKVANQMKLKTGEMPTLAAVASELGRRGNQGALDVIVAKGTNPRRPLHFVEGTHTTATSTPLSGQELLLMRRHLSWAGGDVTVEEFAPTFA
jgi:hypothetical protein